MMCVVGRCLCLESVYEVAMKPFFAQKRDITIANWEGRQQGSISRQLFYALSGLHLDFINRLLDTKFTKGLSQSC